MSWAAICLSTGTALASCFQTVAAGCGARSVVVSTKRTLSHMGAHARLDDLAIHLFDRSMRDGEAVVI